MTIYGIRADGAFVMRNNNGNLKRLGVVAKRNGAGRWQYRDSDRTTLYCSGMEPGAFIARFWHADPASYDPQLGFTPEAEAL